MPWEIAFLEWIDRTLHGSDFINQIIKYFSVLGDVGILWIIIGVILLAMKKYRRCGVVLLVSLLVGYLFNDLLLKKLIMRSRPWTQSETLADFVLPLFAAHEGWGFLNRLLGGSLPSGSSFPSGHTYCAFNVATVLYFTNKKRFGVLAWILASCMGLSRLFLVVHYPSDVLAGAILGFLTAFLFVRIFRKWAFTPKEAALCD